MYESVMQWKYFIKHKFTFRYRKIVDKIDEEDRPMSAQSKSSKLGFSNLDASGPLI